MIDPSPRSLVLGSELKIHHAGGDHPPVVARVKHSRHHRSLS